MRLTVYVSATLKLIKKKIYDFLLAFTIDIHTAVENVGIEPLYSLPMAACKPLHFVLYSPG